MGVLVVAKTRVGVTVGIGDSGIPGVGKAVVVGTVGDAAGVGEAMGVYVGEGVVVAGEVGLAPHAVARKPKVTIKIVRSSHT